jgi:hypothetical protein
LGGERLMNPFDIFIGYVSWGNDGKIRPVLVYETEDDIISVYAITSQYKNKSTAVQNQFFEIIDWGQAGLDRQSYIDTGKIVELPVASVSLKSTIGKLSETDKKRFLEFLSK